MVDWIAITGESMMPFLSSGSWVGVEWLRGGTARIGELVLCRSAEGDWILHRVVRVPTKRNNLWMIKGDAARIVEAYREDELWGRVVAIRRTISGETIFLSPAPVDRAIAFFSLGSVNSGRFTSALFRRMVRGLALCRRLAT